MKGVVMCSWPKVQAGYGLLGQVCTSKAQGHVSKTTRAAQQGDSCRAAVLLLQTSCRPLQTILKSNCCRGLPCVDYLCEITDLQVVSLRPCWYQCGVVIGAEAESISGVLKGGMHGGSTAHAPALDVHGWRTLLVLGDPGFTSSGCLPRVIQQLHEKEISKVMICTETGGRVVSQICRVSCQMSCQRQKQLRKLRQPRRLPQLCLR